MIPTSSTHLRTGHPNNKAIGAIVDTALPVPGTVPTTLPAVTTIATSMFTLEGTEAQGARALPEATAPVTGVAWVRLTPGSDPRACALSQTSEKWPPCHAWGLWGEAGRGSHICLGLEEGGQDAEERRGGWNPGPRKVVGFCDPVL